MKKQSIFITSIIGILGLVSVSMWMFSLQSAEADVIIPCDWEPRPDNPDEITCVPSPGGGGGWPKLILDPQPLPPMGDTIVINQQPLPRLYLNSSLFSNTTEIKISPLMDESVIIGGINSTNGSNTNTSLPS